MEKRMLEAKQEGTDLTFKMFTGSDGTR